VTGVTPVGRTRFTAIRAWAGIPVVSKKRTACR